MLTWQQTSGQELLTHIKYPITLWPFCISLILFCIFMVDGWLNFIIQICLCPIHVSLMFLYNQLCLVIELNSSIVVNSLGFTNKVAYALSLIIQSTFAFHFTFTLHLVVIEQLQHKLNYFSFCKKFENYLLFVLNFQ
jgi:hypothetical protein